MNLPALGRRAMPAASSAMLLAATTALLTAARREARRYTRLVLLIGHLLLGAMLAWGTLPWLRAQRDQTAANALMRWWNRRLLAILCVRVTVHGQPARGAVLYVSNHVSWLDIVCLRSVVDGAFVAKDDVSRWPIVGAMAARAGTIFLERGAAENGDVAERMTWVLSAHGAIILFPEGTTTTGGEVRHFHARLYQAAIRTRAQVQAIALAYPGTAGDTHPAAPFIDDQELISHLWRLLEEPGLEAQLTFCAPLAPGGQPRRALAEHTRRQIELALGIAGNADGRIAI